MKRALTAILLLIAALAQAATLKMREETVAATARVTLADVAAIEDAPEALSEKLASIVVAYLPEGRQSGEVTAQSLAESLRAAGVNPATVNVTGAVRCLVKAGDPASLVRSDVLSAVRQYLRQTAPRARFEITDLRLDFESGDDFVPAVTAVRPSAAAGPVRFDVADAADTSRTLGHAYAVLSKSVPALVAKRRLVGGHKVSAGDVEVTYVAASGTSDFYSDASEVTGRRVLFTIAPGEPLRLESLESQTVIERGDEVLFLVQTPGMTASVRTVALEDGAVGDIVRLRRLGQRREYLARVVSPGKAEPLGGGQ